MVIQLLGGGNSNMFIFPPNPGEMIQFDYMIFFRWVDSTITKLHPRNPKTNMEPENFDPLEKEIPIGNQHF